MSEFFNSKDDNMNEIRLESKLGNLVSRNQYRIYGLTNEDNPPLLISAQDSLVDSKQEKTLTTFLKKNRIQIEFEDTSSNDRKIYIGVRRDLRDSVTMCSCLIQTIVYYLEKRLDSLPENYEFGSPQTFTYKETKQ